MVIQPIAGFNGFHTLESVLALVGSSLLLKGLENVEKNIVPILKLMILFMKLNNK